MAGMSEEDKAKNLKDAFGERGSAVAAMIAQKSTQDQFDTIHGKISGGADLDLFTKYSETSTLQQSMQAWRDLQNLLIDIGNTALPAVNTGLRDLDGLMRAMSDAVSGKGWGALGKLLWDKGIKPDLGPLGRLNTSPPSDDDRQPPVDMTDPRRRGLYHEQSYVDDGVDRDDQAGRGSAPRMGWDAALTIWADTANNLRDAKAAIAGPAMAAWEGAKTDLDAIRDAVQLLGEGLAAVIKSGGLGGAGGLANASFETGDAGGSFGDTGGGSGAGGAWWTPDRITHAVQRLKNEAGLSQAGAEGLVARWAAVESPNGPASVNPKSGALGIGQWLGSRRHGVAAGFDPQISKVVRELAGPESRAGAILRRARNAVQAALGATAYERAEGWNGTTDRFTARTAAAARRIGRDLAEQAGKVDSASIVSGGARGGGAGHVVHRHKHGDVIVNGAGDPETVADKVMRKMKGNREFRTHDVDFDT